MKSKTPAIPCIFKKRKGFLNLIAGGGGLAWSDETSSSSTIAAAASLTIPFDTVISQFANKQGSEKIMLKVSLKPRDAGGAAESVSWTFPSIQDRDATIVLIKEGMSRLLAETAVTASSTSTSKPISDEDAKARQKILSIHPEWKKLHRDLVVVQRTLTEEEFWQSRKELLDQQQWTSGQRRGMSSTLIADINPDQADGNASTGIKFTLNADTIHSIFTQYPGIHKCYLDYVPDKLSEKEFWTSYFSSKWFHRNKVVSQTASTKKAKDIFEPYMQDSANDLNEHPENLDFKTQNSLLDLTTTLEDHLNYGNAPDSTMKAGRVRESLPMIRKFNRHSGLILKDLEAGARQDQSKRIKLSHSQQIQKETNLGDLDVVKEREFVPLSIQDPTRYFDFRGTSSAGESRSPTSPKRKAPALSNTPKVNGELFSLNSLKQLDLASLSKKGSILETILLGNSNEKSVSVNIPEKLENECKSLQASGNELLRHFWASLANKDRLERIVPALERLQESMTAYEESLIVVSDANACKGLLVGLKISVKTAIARYSQPSS